VWMATLASASGRLGEWAGGICTCRDIWCWGRVAHAGGNVPYTLHHDDHAACTLEWPCMHACSMGAAHAAHAAHAAQAHSAQIAADEHAGVADGHAGAAGAAGAEQPRANPTKLTARSECLCELRRSLSSSAFHPRLFDRRYQHAKAITYMDNIKRRALPPVLRRAHDSDSSRMV